MQNKFLKILILSLFAVLLVQSCGNRKHEVAGEKFKKISDKDLVDSLFTLQAKPFEFFYSKIGVDIEGTQQSASFKASVKMRVDSAFSGTVSYAAIIGATYLVTADSAMFTDKTKKCYRAETLDYLGSIFGTAIDYEFFQSLILGQPIGIADSINYKQINHKNYYLLSSHKKREFKRLDKDPEKAEDDEIIIQYYINPESFQLDKIMVNVPADTVDITINYLTRKQEEGFAFDFPELTEINIRTARDSTKISLNYGSVRLNSPKKIGISIPDSYVECE